MIEIIEFILNSIILLILGLIISDMVSFIYKSYLYYENLSPGDKCIYFSWPNKKTNIIVIEKNKGKILYQYIYPDGSKGSLDYSFAPLFYLSSMMCNE